MLHRSISPISIEAWKDIDERAVEVLKTYLSARKVVKVLGPKGLDYNAVPEGKLDRIQEVDGIFHAPYKVLPLTETRVEFELLRWGLDDVGRGRKDVDYTALEEALAKLALFEDKIIFDELDRVKANKDIHFGKDEKAIMDAISQGVITLRENFVKPPYALIVPPDIYTRILSQAVGYPLDKKIRNLIDGHIIINHVIKDAYLLPINHDDLELTIGRDFSIGYQYHDLKTVRLFATESFAFRVLDDSIFVKLTI